MTEKLIKSKQRVSDFGEVFTPAHIVKDMCDLVPAEMWVSIDITFLEPTVAYKIDADKHIFQVVREGMIMVADDVQWPMGSGITQLADLPYGVAIKTGTPQVTTDTFNSTILGYYPAEDPQICFGIVLEKGEFSRLMVRNIIESYFYDNYQPVTNENGDIILPWGGQSTNTPGRPARGELTKNNSNDTSNSSNSEQ